MNLLPGSLHFAASRTSASRGWGKKVNDSDFSVSDRYRSLATYSHGLTGDHASSRARRVIKITFALRETYHFLFRLLYITFLYTQLDIFPSVTRKLSYTVLFRYLRVTLIKTHLLVTSKCIHDVYDVKCKAFIFELTGIFLGSSAI